VNPNYKLFPRVLASLRIVRLNAYGRESTGIITIPSPLVYLELLVETKFFANKGFVIPANKVILLV